MSARDPRSGPGDGGADHRTARRSGGPIRNDASHQRDQNKTARPPADPTGPMRAGTLRIRTVTDVDQEALFKLILFVAFGVMLWAYLGPGGGE